MTAERPALRRDVVLRRLEGSGESYIVVKDPEAQKYFKFETWEHDLLVLYDGTRDVKRIAEEFSRVHPERPVGPQFVLDYADGLRGLGLLERGERERHLVMMDKLKTLRKRRFYDAESSSLTSIQFPLFDPDRMMDRALPWIRWWWSPWFVIPWVVIFAVVLGFLVRHWEMYWAGFFGMLRFATRGPLEYVAFFALLAAVSVWHELGHAFTCKRFGGEVHKIGFMIFWFAPAFYCNIDDSYLFPRKSHRIYCTFGGPYFELMLCSVAAATWLLTPAEWVVHEVALAVVFLTGLSVVVLNVNPLIKLDGYYVLMDLLDVPDLREESFQHLGSRIKKHLFRLEVEEKPISRRRRRIYLVYGALSLLYTLFILWIVFATLRGWFLGWFGPAGTLVVAGLMGLLLRQRIVRSGRFLRHLWLDKKDLLLAPGRRAVGGLAVLLVVALVTVPRCPTRIGAAFLVEPGRRVVVRATTEGSVVTVHAREGDRVAEGEVLALLENRDLSAQRRQAASALERASRAAAAAREGGDAAAARQRAAEAEEARSRLGVLDVRLDALVLRSPFPGVVETPRLEEVEGRYLAAGEPYCAIADLRTVHLEVALPEREVEEIAEGLRARLLPAAYPGAAREARVLSIAPLARPPEPAGQPLDLVRRVQVVTVRVEIDNPDGRLRPGMTGRIQFLARPRSLLGKLAWGFERWAGSIFW